MALYDQHNFTINMKTGVIVARFQVPELHVGHIHLIEEVKHRADKTIIVLGCTEKPDYKNPLSFEIRREMIRDLFPDATILKIYDQANDANWSRVLDIILTPYKEVMLYGSRDSFKKCYTGSLPYTSIEELPGYSGTKVREEIKYLNNREFRQGIIHAFQTI